MLYFESSHKTGSIICEEYSKAVIIDKRLIFLEMLPAFYIKLKNYPAIEGNRVI